MEFVKNLQSFLQSHNKSVINQACSGPYWENIGPRADILPVRPSRLVNKIYVRPSNSVSKRYVLLSWAIPLLDKFQLKKNGTTPAS